MTQNSAFFRGSQINVIIIITKEIKKNSSNIINVTYGNINVTWAFTLFSSNISY